MDGTAARMKPQEAQVIAAAASQDAAIFRCRENPTLPCRVNESVQLALEAFNRVVATRESEVLLMWPRCLDGPGLLPALAALGRLGDGDRTTLTTAIFPWNRKTSRSQRQLLVDREYVHRTALQALARIKPSHHANAYLLGLHSLKHVMDGEKAARLNARIANKPEREHPTLFELMPEYGLESTGLHAYGDHFLGFLRKYSWLEDRHFADAINPYRTPFLQIGFSANVPIEKALTTAGLHPSQTSRRPDVILVDLTLRVRRRLEYEWEPALDTFLNGMFELYLDDCPAILALTDDVFTCQRLRPILREYDRSLSANVNAFARSIRAAVILTASSNPTDAQTITTCAASSFSIETYGTDILHFAELGFHLRRSFMEAGARSTADLVSHAANALQNVLSLPGEPQLFHQFFSKDYESYERQRIGSRFDFGTPRSNLGAILKAGTAGLLHAALVAFLREFDRLRTIADTDNPGRRRFDDFARYIARSGSKTLIALPDELQLRFAEWRIANDPLLGKDRDELSKRLTLIDTPDLAERLSRSEDKFDQLVFIEPRADQLLAALTLAGLPAKVVVSTNLARVEQILRRAVALSSLAGIDPLAPALKALATECERVLVGHRSDIGELDEEVNAVHSGTLDLTSVAWGGGAGPVRTIVLSGGWRVRAFDGSEFALYEPGTLRHFSRRLAKDLLPGDQVCLFDADYMEAVRSRLKQSVDAPDVLNFYHKAVAEAADSLPGGWDWEMKAQALRTRMVQIDARLDLPSLDAMRRWIEVRTLIDSPRHAVRPHAPRDRRHFLVFMQALKIGDVAARYYWEMGVAMTRSERIKGGASFHQSFMGILIDPDGTASRLDEALRPEIWKIYDSADEHTEMVKANQPGDTQ